MQNSLWEFFSLILSCLMESLLQKLSGSSLFFLSKNEHQNTANLTLQQILAAKLGYIESFEV